MRLCAYIHCSINVHGLSYIIAFLCILRGALSGEGKGKSRGLDTIGEEREGFGVGVGTAWPFMWNFKTL